MILFSLRTRFRSCCFGRCASTLLRRARARALHAQLEAQTEGALSEPAVCVVSALRILIILAFVLVEVITLRRFALHQSPERVRREPHLRAACPALARALRLRPQVR